MVQPAGRPSPAASLSPWFVGIVALFVTCLIVSNIIAVKLFTVLGHPLPAAVIVFPLTYIFGDVLTEVYGYRRAQQVIWLGFLCNLVAVGAIYAGQLLPPAGFWDGQAAYERILGYSPRLLLGSFVAYLAGELLNAAVLARMKLLTRGRWLFSRTIGSTLAGQAADSAVFLSIAFAGTDVPLGSLILSQWAFKVVFEALATPLTYGVVGFLKAREGMDIYDAQVSLNPFRLWS
ncbi:MAG: queuosine precursor transporter [Chloroflexi bacterium]|nr:queuosine precursor transporter [Chloroflexota bacterium]